MIHCEDPRVGSSKISVTTSGQITKETHGQSIGTKKIPRKHKRRMKKIISQKEGE